MTKLILHIGLQKTGTTFLQQNFHGRARKLRSVGVQYLSPKGNLPTNKVSAAHHWMVAAIRNLPNSYIPSVPFSFLPQYVQNLRTKIGRNDYPLALMSSENFSRMTDPQVAKLRQHLRGIDTEIVIYLRRQDIWIDSWYAQMVKTGRKISLDEAVAEMRGFLDYRSLIARWGKNFGKDNIRLGVYENLDTPDALWADFFKLIGCPEAAEIELQEETANVTLAPQLTAFIEIAQKTTGYNPALRRFLESVNPQFERGTALKFMSEDQARTLVDEYVRCNQEIARDFFGRDHLFKNTEVVGSNRQIGLNSDDLVDIIATTNMALLGRISELETRLEQLELKPAKQQKLARGGQNKKVRQNQT